MIDSISASASPAALLTAADAGRAFRAPGIAGGGPRPSAQSAGDTRPSGVGPMTGSGAPGPAPSGPSEATRSTGSTSETERATATAADRPGETRASEDARRDPRLPGMPDGIERMVRAARQAAENWRTRLDPETLRLFTEVVDPVTREARYRVPPTAISEAAERESEFRARYERMTRPLVEAQDAPARLL